jgi:LmbE family N-acetylglucosaminyl deacetylase
MPETFKLLTIFPHPDDESLGMGGVLAKYAAEGVQVTLVCLTRGERGWPGPKETNPGFQELGELRERELRCAAQALGAHEIVFLGYLDGDVDRQDPAEITAKIAAEIRRVQPQVVVTFGPDGAYGHPDHIACSQFTHTAVIRAADARFIDSLAQHPYAVKKLYYMVDSIPLVEIIRQTLGGINFTVDGENRHHWGWPDWMITTRIDAQDYASTAWDAILCHQSQLPGMPGLEQMPEAQRRQVWGVGNFYRALSFVNADRAKEDDLFAGLRTL